MSLRLLAFVSAAAALATPAMAAERSFSVTDFNKVRVDGPYRVRLKTGVAPFAKASGSPAALDGVSIDLLGQTLVVRRNPSSFGGYPGESRGPVDIVIGTHDLTTAWVNGAGSVSIDSVKGQSLDLSIQGSGSVSVGKVAVDRLRVGITGTGSSTVGGNAADASVIVRGTGSMDGTYLIARNATIGAEGSSEVKINATGTAKIDVAGTSSVLIGGQPSCTVRASGSAVVNGCR